MSYFLYFCLFLAASFSGEEPIGKVVALEGSVKALTDKNGEIFLEPESPIFVSETILVGEEARAQIEFTDGTLLNLNPNSAFRVRTYSYKKLLKKDQYLADLTKGGLRSLSGSIAKKNPEEYEIETPSATIGLRGTLISVNIVEGEVFFEVEEGRAVIKNESGSLMIGRGEKTDFSIVPGKNRAPEMVFQRPSALNLNHFAPPHGALPLRKAAPQAPSAAEGSHPSPPRRETSPLPKKHGGSGVQIHGGC